MDSSEARETANDRSSRFAMEDFMIWLCDVRNPRKVEGSCNANLLIDDLTIRSGN